MSLTRSTNAHMRDTGRGKTCHTRGWLRVEDAVATGKFRFYFQSIADLWALKSKSAAEIESRCAMV